MMAKRVPIDTYCEKNISTLPKTYDGFIDYIDISSVDNTEKMIKTFQTIKSHDAPSRAKQLLKKGDVLVSTVRPNLNAIAVVEEETENLLVGSTGYCVLRCNDKMEVRYLYYFCQSQYFIDDMSSQATGASYPAVSNGIVRNSLIPCYSIEEQREIAKKMDSVNNLLMLRKQQLAKLDELVKARFVELFGDPLDNTKGLPVEPFANCCLDMHQGINTVADKVEYQPSGYPIIQSKNITKGFLDLDDVRYLTNEDYEKYREKYNPKVNDILICNIGTIGKSLVIKDEKNFLIAWNLFLVKLNLEKVNPDYVKVFVEFLNDRHYYDQFLTGGTVKFVNKKTMGNIPVLMPSIEQQNQFSDFVKQTDKSKLTVQQSLDTLEVMKKALMQKYFG